MERLAIIDVEGTVCSGTGDLKLLDALVGLGAPLARERSAVRAIRWGYHSGRLSYAEMVERASLAYAKAVAAVSAETLAVAAAQVWEHERCRLRSVVLPLFQVMADEAITPVLVSSGPGEVIAAMASDPAFSHRFEPRRRDVPAVVADLLAAAGSSGEGCLVLGASPADVGAFEQVEHAVVYEPGAELQALARRRRWQIADWRNVVRVVEACVTLRSHRCP